MALTTTDLSNLGFVARGKVRDLYAFPEDEKSLLFVATDRVPSSLSLPDLHVSSRACLHSARSENDRNDSRFPPTM
jgi:hypothetical protein